MPPKERHSGHGGSGGMFLVDLGLTDAGSIRIQFRPGRPLRSFYGHEREVAQLIYMLAAEFEHRCGDLGVAWAISPDPSSARIDVELGEGEESEPAAEVVRAVLSDFELQ
jgi:hypothetical protein